MRIPAVSFSAQFRRLCAIAGLVAIAGLGGCATTGPAGPPVPQKPTQTTEVPGPVTTPTHPLRSDDPNFLRLGNISPSHTPIRVGVLLPFGNANPATRGLANTMMKAAELAMFDSGLHDLVLMTADEGAGGDTAVASVHKLLDQGAEVIIGPLYATSVRLIAPITRDRSVPLISFSTDNSVAGDGVYLLSFQPQDSVRRVVRYAAATGHKNFAAVVPSNLLGQIQQAAFRKAVDETGGTVTAIQQSPSDPTAVQAPSLAVAKTGPDAVLIGHGGSAAGATASALRADGLDPTRMKLLGAGPWDDTAAHDPALSGTLYAATPPYVSDAFNAKYKATYGATPPALSSLSYDAVTLVAALSGGAPYHRFTPEAFTDPNGFAGVDGIFRFHTDGTIERGLAVFSTSPTGATMVDPPPRTFQGQTS
jgi:branched-chain amino acid transport system substrate-binding protein